MAPNEIAKAAVIQTSNYLDVAMCILVFHDYFVNFADELNLIWSRSTPKLSIGLFAVLRYGGLLYALLAALQHTGAATHQFCYVNVILEYIILQFFLYFALEWMMTSRVYALYGDSKKARILLLACFLVEQAMCAVPTIAFMHGFNFYDTQGSELGGNTCVFEPTELSIAQADAANVVCLLFQIVLFLMVSFSFSRLLREHKLSRAWSTQGFYMLVIREHVLYFIFMVMATSFGIVSFEVPAISSATQECVARSAALDTVVKLSSTFSSCIIGPRMMLSIRRFDADQLRGGTLTESRVETLQFAAYPTQSEEDMNV